MSHDLGCLLAIAAARKHMSQTDQDVVSSAMSTRSDQLEKELAKYADVDPETWTEHVVEAAHKVLGRERKKAPDNVPTYIECKTCGLKSFSPDDIVARYCGMCHKFHMSTADFEIGPTPKEVDTIPSCRCVRFPDRLRGEVATVLTAVLSPELVERMKAFAESAQVHRELVLDSDDERPTDPEP